RALFMATAGREHLIKSADLCQGMRGVLGIGIALGGGPELFFLAALGNEDVDVTLRLRRAMPTLGQGEYLAKRFVGVIEVCRIQVLHGLVPQSLLVLRDALQFEIVSLRGELLPQFVDLAVHRAIQLSRFVELCLGGLVVLPARSLLREVYEIPLLIFQRRSCGWRGVAGA